MKISAAAMESERSPPLARVPWFLEPWRLEAYGGAIVALYLALLGCGFYRGLWILDASGKPLSFDFSLFWLAGAQALHGHVARLYDTAAFLQLQHALFGASPYFYPHWAYPPSFLLVLAPLALLGFAAAFFTWELTTLLGCIVVVYRIVGRRPAIVLVLASPFSLWNLMTGQTGFLTAALIGAALLTLERRPVLAGVFLGLLTYKPQFGILFPVALLATGEWRAIFAAAATAILLALASMAVFGTDAWAAFPRELLLQGGFNLTGAGTSNWALDHTVYGLARCLGAGAAPAGAAQAATTVALGVLVWRVWRSPARYSLKAAAVAAAALIATPYSLAYDMAAVAIPLAFLAKDQLRWGLLRGEQTVMAALFLASFSVIPTVGRGPVGLFVVIALLCLILRRVVRAKRIPQPSKCDDISETAATAGN